MSDENDKKIKITEYGSKKESGKSGVKIDIYSNDPQDGPHDSIHIKVDTDNKKYEAITKIDGVKESSSGSCYLTSACMKHMQEYFDDNCEELTILRWFRDEFVSDEDINHYYKTAPMIVDSIDELEENGDVYNYIYINIVNACVVAIKNGDYDFAYNRYKNSILALEEQFVRPNLTKRLVKTLKYKIQNS